MYKYEVSDFEPGDSRHSSQLRSTTAVRRYIITLLYHNLYVPGTQHATRNRRLAQLARVKISRLRSAHSLVTCILHV